MPNRNSKLGEILVEKKWIDNPTLEEALKKQKTDRKFLGSILIADGKITEEQLAEALSLQFQLPFVKIKNFYIDWKLVMRFRHHSYWITSAFHWRRKAEQSHLGLQTHLMAGCRRKSKKKHLDTKSS